MLALGLVAWCSAVFMLAGDPPEVDAGSVRSVEMAIAYPSGEAWEVVQFAILIEDEGSNFDDVEAAARAERLARYPGGIEVSPEVSGQFDTFGFALDGRTATWFYNPAHKPDSLEGEDEYVAFQDGASAWNHAGDTDFHFEEGGLTDAELSMCIGDGRDGQNTVGWRTLTAPVIAETCWIATPGQPQEFDVQFSRQSAWTLGTTDVQVDLQSVVIHEFGHALGLKHSNVQGSVMYSGYKRGNLLREPAADDISGLRAIYGEASPTPTPTPTVPPGPVTPQSVIPALSRQ